jgi:hypothetical protein
MKKIVSIIGLTFAIISTITAGTVDLSWNASTPAVDVVGYKVYQLSTTNGVFATNNVNVVLAKTVVGVNSTNVSVTGLSSGFVRFAVTAYNSAGTNLVESAFSNEASTTVLNIPSVPQQVKITGVTPN